MTLVDDEGLTGSANPGCGECGLLSQRQWVDRDAEGFGRNTPELT
jgi:hypothetical protein